MNFKDIEKIESELTPEVKQAFKNLGENKDWRIANEFMEQKYFLLWSYNLLATNDDTQDIEKEVQSRRGAFRAWQMIKRLINRNE